MHVLYGYVLRALSDIRIVTVIELRKRSHKNYAQPAFLVNKAQHNQTLGYLTYSAYFPSVFIHKDILWRFWMEGKPSLDWQKFSIKMKEEYGILSKIMEKIIIFQHWFSLLSTLVYLLVKTGCGVKTISSFRISSLLKTAAPLQLIFPPSSTSSHSLPNSIQSNSCLSLTSS